MSLLDFTFDPQLERAATLPARCYTDPAYLEAERRQIFFKTWQCAGRLDELPVAGSYFATEVASEPILIVRDQHDTVRAFHNVCRHRANLIADGQGTCEKFRCGYHGWTYGLDGQLLGAPDFEGVADFQRHAMGLREVKLATWEQFIFVKIDAANELSLPETLGDIVEKTAHHNIAQMQFVERHDYVIECNWKVYVDNYLEGYHIPLVHPSLMRELDYTRYRTIPARYHSLQDAPIKSGEDPLRRYNPSAGQTEALYFWVFPNLMLNIYPDNTSINLIVPLGHDRTLTIFEWFFHEPKAEAVRTTVELSEEIQREDISICERVQKGLRSVAYDRGRYSVKRENGLHHFHALWDEFMRR